MINLKNEQLTVKVSAMGAELQSVFSQKHNIEYLWQAQKEIWPRYAPVLFPIVGKLKNGSYFFNGKNYELPQHGFARDQHFSLLSFSETSAVFELRHTDELKKHFPFEFSLVISYLLLENELISFYKVSNFGAQSMYFSLGTHPGFSCSVKDAVTMADFFLEFEKEENCKRFFVKEGLISQSTSDFVLPDKKLKLDKNLFEKDALVFKDLTSQSVKLLNNKNGHGLNVMWDLSFGYFGVWAKAGCDKFVCLEPWAGIADADNASGKLEEKEGIMKLESGENKEFKIAYSFF